MRSEDPLPAIEGPHLAIRLVRMLGVPPFAPPAEECLESAALLRLARRNGLEYLYLAKLADTGTLEGFRGEFEEHRARHASLHGATRSLTAALEAAESEYAFLRALRPYPATPRDLDILALGGDGAYRRLGMAIRSLGYDELPASRTSTLFRLGRGPAGEPSPDTPIEVELYREIAVHGLVVFDKDRLRGLGRLSEFANFVDGTPTPARLLLPWVDLFLACLHSLTAKGAYRLDLLYTVVHDLAHSDDADLRRLIELCTSAHLGEQVGHVLALTGSVLEAALGKSDQRLDSLARMLTRAASPGSEAVTRCSWPLPYPPGLRLSATIRALLTHRKGIWSAARLLGRMVDPRYAARMSRRLLASARSGAGRNQGSNDKGRS